MENIRDRIKNICKRKGTTLKALAECIGTTADSLGTTLAKNNPTLDTLRKISNALNVSISELVEEPQKDGISVSGFLKIDNQIHEIKNIEDLKNICITL